MSKFSFGCFALVLLALGSTGSSAAPAPTVLETQHEMALYDIARFASTFIGDSEIAGKENRGEIVKFVSNYCKIPNETGEQRYGREGYPWCQCFVNAIATLQLRSIDKTGKHIPNLNDNGNVLVAWNSAKHKITPTPSKSRATNFCGLSLSDLKPGWAIVFSRNNGANGHAGIVSEVRGPLADGLYEITTVEGNITEKTGSTDKDDGLPDGVWKRTYRLSVIGNDFHLLDGKDSEHKLLGFYPLAVPSDPADACLAMTGRRLPLDFARIPTAQVNANFQKAPLNILGQYQDNYDRSWVMDAR